MMELMDDLLIKCNECGKEMKICRDDFDFESCSYDHGDNGMGDEIEYYCNENISCSECGNEINIKISGYEYPVGAFNNETCEISGGEFLEKPHMTVVYSDDGPDWDD